MARHTWKSPPQLAKTSTSDTKTARLLSVSLWLSGSAQIDLTATWAGLYLSPGSGGAVRPAPGGPRGGRARRAEKSNPRAARGEDATDGDGPLASRFGLLLATDRP